MAQQSDSEEETLMCKRRRITGSSKWTVNSISRQMAERQAMIDVDDMLIQQGELIAGCDRPGSSEQPEDAENPPISQIIQHEISTVCDEAFEFLGKI